ncbi:hypothetical protein ISU10_06570 [Nocardioides agariphilus]|uniref:Uncharacterized protein n=1 Tax=Nocardioides agariphilus TaxID=433664 RepID=A0A930YHV9_9ACTN|nr:hypothetical protein [Nocardioides agariphilus]MBF4767428.1 hypothetical protein [Nocardioides agariphilus]
MTRLRLTRWAVLGLGLIYVAAGIAETTRAVKSGDGGIPFWFGTLVGGGALLLTGEAVHRHRPGLGATLVCVGCLVTVPATIWTLLVPALALAVCVLVLKRYDEQTAPAGGEPPETGTA